MRASPVSLLSAVVLLCAGVGPATAGPFLLPVVAQVMREGEGGIDSLEAVSDVALDPDGDHLYVTARDDDALTVFTRDSMSGAFLPSDVERDGVGGVDGLDGAMAVAVSPDGAHVYATGWLDDSVVAFARDTSTGVLDFVAACRDGVGGVTGLDGPLSLVLSPDGAHVYVTTLGGTIAAFARNGVTGELTQIQVTNLNASYRTVMSPDGAHLYVYVSGGPPQLVAFARDGSSGLLSSIGPMPSAGGAAAFSPDGSLLYSNDGAGGVVVFERDALTGALVKREQLRRLLDGDGFLDMAVSADGEYVYAVSGNGYVVVLRHDAITGAVSLRDRRRPPSDQPGEAIAVHPSGALVVVGGTDNFSQGKVVAHRLEARACDPTPRMGCTQPLFAGTSRLVLKSPPASQKNTAVWTWARGPETPIEAFGDVFTTTHHALCVYDASGAPQPVLGAVAPPGGVCAFDGTGGRSCWDYFPDSITVEYYRYRDTARRDGLRSMLLHAGSEGHAKLKVKGNGPTLAAAPSPLTLPVRVQLQNDAGACWEATYGAADGNAGGLFRARSD